jgi:hypothetical protein
LNIVERRARLNRRHLSIGRLHYATQSGICSLRFAIVLALAITAACGKKGPPLAPIVRVPGPVSAVTALRLGSDVYVSVTIPAQNIDASIPADLERVEVYGFTGRSAPGARFLEGATLVATIPVVPIERDASGRPVSSADDGRTSDAIQGSIVTIRDRLSDAELEPVTLPPPPSRRGAPPPASAVPASTTPGPLQRFYTAIGFSDRERTSPQGVIASLPLSPLPDPPADPRIEYTPEVVRLMWEPSGGLLGFILDRPLPPEESPVDEDVVPLPIAPFAPTSGGGVAPTPRTPTTGSAVAPLAPTPGTPIAPTTRSAIAPFAPATGGPIAAPVDDSLPLGPTRYSIYREVAPDPLVLPAGPAPGPWRAELPQPLTAQPVSELMFEDSNVIDGRERCYQVRAVRGSGPAAVASDPTPRLCFTALDTTPPVAPTMLTAQLEDGAITLFWDPNVEEDLAGYLILRGAPGDATLTALNETPVESARFVDRTATPGTRYVYAVVAVDNRVPLGNISAESNRVEAGR